MLKQVFSTILIAGSLSFATAASAATFNFADYADNTYGEMGADFFLFSESGVNLEVAAANGYDPINQVPLEMAFPYLDSGNAGLGVCKIIDGNSQCTPRSDDNLQTPEALGMWFIDNNDEVLPARITEITFKNSTHGTTFADGATFWLQIDGGTPVEYDLTSQFNNVLEGYEFIFWAGDQADSSYYISSLTANVPAPAPLALLALGLLGVYGASRKRKSA